MLSTTTITSLLALAAGAAAKSVSTTPHDKYSSSVGVLGCKIDTNRVAYWPGSVDCNNICVKLSHEGRSVHLLRIDQSGGAYDISYDAWAYLQTGKPAKADPINGGGVAMEYEEVDASECAHLLKTKDKTLPLSASNSMNFLSSCLAQPDSWVAKNYALYNICDAICTLGHDEPCTLDLAVSNQPSCKNTLGLTTKLTSAPVYDVQFGTGKSVLAGTGGAGVVVDVPDTTYDNGSPAPTTTKAKPAAPTKVEHVEQPQQQKPSSFGGVFHEAPTTTSAAAAVTTSSSSSSQVVVPSSSSSSSSSAATSEAPSSSASQAPSSAPSLTTLVTSSIVTPSPSMATPSTTFASVSRSSPAASPSASATGIPASAGRRGVEVSLLALVSSVVACSLVGLF